MQSNHRLVQALVPERWEGCHIPPWWFLPPQNVLPLLDPLQEQEGISAYEYSMRQTHHTLPGKDELPWAYESPRGLIKMQSLFP